MFEHAAPHLLKVDESNWATADELVEADIEIYKYTHAELGYRACVHWRLPESICDVVQLHHMPVDSEIVPGSINAMLFCLQVADNLCLALLQREDFADFSPDEREQIITSECLKTERNIRTLPAEKLAFHLNKIHADGRDLLAGLGIT
jgi:HD-like signal output (HDOD) protein